MTDSFVHGESLCSRSCGSRALCPQTRAAVASPVALEGLPEGLFRGSARSRPPPVRSMNRSRRASTKLAMIAVAAWTAAAGWIRSEEVWRPGQLGFSGLAAGPILGSWNGQSWRRAKQVCRCSDEGLEATQIETGAAPAEEPSDTKLLGAASGPTPEPQPGVDGELADPGPVPLARVAPRKFRLLFTCKICETRNSHMISRLAYQQGIVIATCPGCSSKHLIADKTGILDWGLWDVEMLAQRGENVTRLTTDGYEQVGKNETSTARIDALAAAANARKDTGAAAASGSGPGPAAVKKPLLIRNKDGLIEALPEEDVGIGSAAEFMGYSEDGEEGLSTS
ncbi:unnamed protein product [Polarella glacialis]|uniref:DNL-type domain-containing protein n=1 Tax=Polarella glacialis TaxID=89957 RepID=A0A813JB54_POLGL|nr:unnamed protein product [Polarella glacialis]